MTTGALSDIRVIDLTQALAGPMCTMLLADMGADVIKVEPPDAGDPSRKMDPLTPSGESGAYMAVNRNKRGIALNLKDRDAHRLFLELVATADVLVENYRPGVTRRLGIDYETLSDRNQGLVYASISGFGQSGPYSGRGGFDLIAQGMTGIMSVTGRPGGPPVKCGIPVTDLGGGMLAVYGILSALHERQRSRRGQHVETSLFEAGLTMAVWEATEFFYTGRIPQPTGSAHRLSAPYQAFRTRDGHITVGADSDRHWPTFCRVLGLDELVEDPRFASNEARLRHLSDLVPLIEARTSARSSAEWLAQLHELGVPSGPIHTVPDALADPQTAARDMVVQLQHPRAGSIKALGTPVKLSRTPAAVRCAAPVHGQHTDEILAELTTDAGHLDRLRRRGAIR